MDGGEQLFVLTTTIEADLCLHSVSVNRKILFLRVLWATGEDDTKPLSEAWLALSCQSS